MKSRNAVGWFCAAVLMCWISLWLVQTRPRTQLENRTVSLTPQELVGVRRVVWDLDPDQFDGANASETMVLTGWGGDLRLTSSPWSDASYRLQLVRKGDTVFVRAQQVVVAAAPTDLTETEAATPQADTPISLTLPAGITELVWPNVNLVQTPKSEMAEFTVRAYDLQIGVDPSDDWRFANQADHQIAASFRGNPLPGKLGRLNAQLLFNEACAGGNEPQNSLAGTLEYKGGFHGQLQVLARTGNVRLSTAAPDLRAVLRVSPNTRLEVAQIGYLQQVQIQQPTVDELRQLVARWGGNQPGSQLCQAPVQNAH